MTSTQNECDVVVIGAGLSGLASALLVQETGKSVRVLEAHDIPGGRIRSVSDREGNYVADLGPSWVWPSYQPVVTRWIEKLGISIFSQYDTGYSIIDTNPEHAPRKLCLPSQTGNMRVVNGSQAIVDALTRRLGPSVLQTGARVKMILANQENLSVQTDSNTVLNTDKVIVATPPRIALKNIDWSPALPEDISIALGMTDTWMSPHAKFVAIFKNAFWRNLGLSGRVVSQFGPIAECHDHCSFDRSIAALWGLVGWSHNKRMKSGKNLGSEITLQLRRCFGSEYIEPLAVHIEDWSHDADITSLDDLAPTTGHPIVGPSNLRNLYFGDRVAFAGSETAELSPGLIEGAFNSAERAVTSILQLHAQ